MKILFLLTLTIIFTACSVQEKNGEKYEFTYPKDGKTITDTVSIRDSLLRNELHRMLTDPNYKPTIFQSDTVFNEKGNPLMVTLDEYHFGAAFQKFEYDNADRVFRITGYDNQNNIKPFYHDIAIQVNKYDQKGNLVEIRNLGVDGNLISSEFEDTPIIRKKYNNKNQLIEEWYLDENENLRKDFAIFRYEYDTKGNQIKKGWYEKGGK